MPIQSQTSSARNAEENWQNDEKSSELAAAGFAPNSDKESAMQIALQDGEYSLVVSSADGSKGVGVVQVIEVVGTERS